MYDGAIVTFLPFCQRFEGEFTYFPNRQQAHFPTFLFEEKKSFVLIRAYLSNDAAAVAHASSPSSLPFHLRRLCVVLQQ